MSNDVLGSALKAYHLNKSSPPLIVHNDYGEPEIMELESLYRDVPNIPDYEWVMVDQAYGRTLDVGAGGGSHSLLLQEKGLETVALDISQGACEVSVARGVNQILNMDFRNLDNQKFDTVSLVMNGIGIVGTLDGLEGSLLMFKKLINRGGQLLFDSTDVSYLQRKLGKKEYFGEIQFQFEYNDERGDWFNWLYIDTETLKKICHSIGWQCQILFHDGDQYVVRLHL